MRDLILALDTSTPTASVALVGASGLCVLRTEPSRTHGPTVLLLIEEVLKEAGVAPEELAAVACGRGPGSFTGLRIGLATAKGLCFGLGVPLILPSSLEAVARAAPRQGPAVVVACLDARRQELFAAAWVLDDRAPHAECVLPLRAGGPAAIAAAVRALDTALPRLLVGNGVALYREQLTAALEDLASLPEDAPQTPDARVLAALAAQMLERGDVADLDSAEPDYVRPSDAELSRDRRRGQGSE